MNSRPFSGNSYKDILGSLDFSHSKINFAEALFLLVVYRNIGGGGKGVPPGRNIQDCDLLKCDSICKTKGVSVMAYQS